MASFTFSGISMADARDPNAEALGYYRNLSMMAFVYSADLYRLEPDPIMKSQQAKAYWFAAFHYWFDVREKTIPSSKGVLKAIWKIGPPVFSPEDLKLYSDPLGWVARDKPLMTFGSISKERYEQARLEFAAWIEKELKDGQKPGGNKP